MNNPLQRRPDCKRRPLGGAFFAVLLFGLLAGCSNRQAYDAVQYNGRMACEKLPDSQRQECLAQYSGSYEDYRRDREDLIEGDQ